MYGNMRVQVILMLDLTEIEPVLKGGGAVS